MKKKDLVNYIKSLNKKVTVDANIKKLCDEILQLPTSVNNLMTENGKISSQTMVVSNANTSSPTEFEISYSVYHRQTVVVHFIVISH